MTEGKFPAWSRDEELKAILRSWYGRLRSSPGERSELRRAAKVADVRKVQAFYDLKIDMEDAGYRVYDLALARMVGVLAHVRRDREGDKLGILMARHGYSEDRLKRLIRIEDNDLRMRELIRVLRFTQGGAPIIDLADFAYWWNDHSIHELYYEFCLK